MQPHADCVLQGKNYAVRLRAVTDNSAIFKRFRTIKGVNYDSKI